jgi:hypothetical protein
MLCLDATLTIAITHSKTALIWINWDGEASGNAENTDN